MLVRFYHLGLMVIAVCFPSATCAHDFWLQPRSFNVAINVQDPMTIEVGHGPFRSRWSGALDRVVLFRDITRDGGADIKGALHPSSERDAVLQFAKPGVHVVAFESTHAESNLPAIRYNDYIKAEGLAPAIAGRARTRTTDQPGREIYSRRCKALVQVGPADSRSQPQVTKPVGLTLEIVPEKNPYALAPGEPLPVRVLYEGRPLAGALVKLTNLEFDVRPVAMAMTNSAGRAAFNLPRTGDWLINVIWTKAITGNPVADWDTTFSSLTFGFPQKPAALVR